MAHAHTCAARQALKREEKTHHPVFLDEDLNKVEKKMFQAQS